MFDALGDKLQSTIQSIRGQKKITEENVDAAISQVRRALLESDTSLKAVKLFVSRVKDKALGSEVLTGVKPGEQFIKIINDALTDILGGENEELGLKEGLSSILLLGLQGAGKTTAAAKLALKLKKQGRKPLLVPCDLQRPAAIKQLEILAQDAEVDFLKFSSDVAEANTNVTVDEADKASGHRVKNLMDVAKLAKAHADEHKLDVIIYDTAGRLQINTDLMAELLLLEKSIKPEEKLLVIDSLIGQEAVNVAESFDTQIGLTGVILTKLDSDSKGGAALSVVEATQKPIKLASVGEKLEDLEDFHPERMASRILGMGDVVSLVEKAEEKLDEAETKKLEEELMKGNFNYETFMTAQNMMSKLGNFTSVFKMMGMGGMLSQFGLGSKDQEALLDQSQEKMAKFKSAINSMTRRERREPDLMTEASRKKRISNGSGISEPDINQMVAEFNRMKQMFKNMGPMLNMMGGMGGGSPEQSINPNDMMSAMAGGLSKKQKKALQQMGGPGSMMGGGYSAKPKAKKMKKGSKPGIKGFKS